MDDSAKEKLASLRQQMGDEYFDERGHYKASLFTGAKEIAEKFQQEKTSTHQVRMFFAYVKNIEYLIHQRSNEFEQTGGKMGVGETSSYPRYQNQLFDLTNKARYAVARKQVGESFFRFIEKNMNIATRSEKHFLAFVKHFEGVVCYMKEDNRR
ncbi:type III-A CRISPR-associated protein Csm2 [Sulfoacidibacillus thermotolerans]|uniref:CRISPR system Cms protein Csm2 n=1 Tax=Sulfoacidibacillus thermotolerans TaxID=1765684 RepID=A0A2U3D8G5_SULT2|nr:type III-A CRISPR-associated protein Csm2 [Sulfoacidibacillus thermotolerans]PWI57570.1 type III-A CRISPR-associated protein Csm2 [Sulfoacidibacillus thermotolerans]